MDCDVCGKPGELYCSPWGLPVSLVLCRKHHNRLFFKSKLYVLLVLLVTFGMLLASSALPWLTGVALLTPLLLLWPR